MILRDPVHGLIAFEREEERIIVRLLATVEVQRLRRIRQLGLTSFAFPGAEHTRFAHALGAAHVMQQFLTRLRAIHEELPFWQRVTSERAREAIVAAFLHDLGHGPLSHLFEEAMPGAVHHETWTERILLDPGTEVHSVLAESDPDLPRRVAALVRGEHELPYLAKTVSGTFDVDRCDYLLRDAHATGVRHGEYDLPWLLRSLRFGPSSSGATDMAPGLAIDGTKGLSAIESFVLARYFMFQQVYFHKSTRSGEWMMGAILRRAIRLLQEGVRLPQVPPAMMSIAAEAEPSLGEYLELDDQVLLSAIGAWRDASDPILADLCKRIRARALFKSVELVGGQGALAERNEADERRFPPELSGEAALEIAREIAVSTGLDPEVYVGLDVAADTPYSDDSSLTVMYPHGRTRRPAEVSFVLDRMRDETMTRTRILFAPELKEAVRAALAR